jgi:phosphatidylglycerophosphate synthase
MWPDSTKTPFRCAVNTTHASRQLRLFIVNGLTLSRLFAALPYLMFPSLRIPIASYALATEFLDGCLARRWTAISAFGRLLDPIADKIFVGCALLALALGGRLDYSWLFLLLLRDLCVLTLVGLALLSRRVAPWPRLQPRPSGKFATSAQFLALLALLSNAPYASTLVLGGVLASAIAAVDYLVIAVRAHGAAR